MSKKVIEVGHRARYVDEIRQLQVRNTELEKHNLELDRKLEELHGEYLQLRYAMKGMATQGEVLALRRTILELQKKLRFKGMPPGNH